MAATTFSGPLHTYRLALIAGLTMVVVVLAYLPTFARMMDMWSLVTYQHGWFVFPVSLYVLWRKREALATLSGQTSWLGVAVTASLVLSWLMAGSAGIQVVEFASATLIISAVFWAIAGTAAMREAAFPLLLLLTAVPTGEFLVEPLMLVTAKISLALLTVAGVPVFRDGQFFTLPGGNFEVADVCSGLRYLLAGVMASLAFGYVTYSSAAKRLLFVLTTAVVLVVTNGVRAFIVMYVASATDMRVFTGADHVWFGTFLFAAVFVGMIWIAERHTDATTQPTHLAARGDVPAAAIDRHAVSLVASAAALVLAVGGPVFQYAKTHQTEPAWVESNLPLLPGCTALAQGPEYPWQDYPHYEGADFVLRHAYACQNRRTDVYVAGYRRQEQGKELISSANRVWPYDWRRYTDQSMFSVAVRGKPTEVREVWVRDPERPRLIWYWYQVGDVVTVSELQAKLLEALHALTLGQVESSVVVVTNAGEPDAEIGEMRSLLEPHAHALMAWNRSRASEGR